MSAIDKILSFFSPIFGCQNLGNCFEHLHQLPKQNQQWKEEKKSNTLKSEKKPI